MRRRLGTYKTYSIGCAIAWLAAFAIVLVRRKPDLSTMGKVCGGWWIGWLSATIARSIYPAGRQQSDQAS